MEFSAVNPACVPGRSDRSLAGIPVAGLRSRQGPRRALASTRDRALGRLATVGHKDAPQIAAVLADLDPVLAPQASVDTKQHFLIQCLGPYLDMKDSSSET